MVVELASFESPQIKLIDAWDRALLAKDLDLAAKYLHKDFRRTTSPRSLGEPDKTKEEWFKAAAKLVNSPVDFSEVRRQSYHPTLPSVEFFLQSIHHSVIAEIPGRVVVHVSIPARSNHLCICLA